MKDGKIYKLSGERYSNTEPNEPLIEMLEDILKQAKNGTLRSLYMTGFTVDGCMVSMFADPEEEQENVWATIGAIDELKHEYRKRKL